MKSSTSRRRVRAELMAGGAQGVPVALSREATTEGRAHSGSPLRRQRQAILRMFTPRAASALMYSSAGTASSGVCTPGAIFPVACICPVIDSE